MLEHVIDEGAVFMCYSLLKELADATKRNEPYASATIIALEKAAEYLCSFDEIEQLALYIKGSAVVPFQIPDR